MAKRIDPSWVENLAKIGKPPDYFDYALNFYADLHIEYCEELCKLWPYTHARLHAVKEKDLQKVIKINEEEAAVRERLWIYRRSMRYLRKQLVWRIENATNTEELKKSQIDRCKKDINYWFCYYAYTFDPRMGDIEWSGDKLSPKVPFCLFPKQKELLASLQSWRSGRFGGGLIEKTREEGVSFLVMAWILWCWLFDVGFTALVTSQQEEKVDVLGSVNPLFGKIRYVLYNLPVWMRPKGYDDKNNKFDNNRFLVNPDNGNEMKGEIGDNIGRSGRCSVLVIDESQDLEHPDKVNDSAESVTYCRIDIGTPNGLNHFWKRRTSGIPVETIAWWHDPRKNPKWQEGKFNAEAPWWKFKQEETPDPIILARNHLIDYNASVAGVFIPMEWIRSAVDFSEPKEDDEKVAGFDVAGSGENEAVYVLRKGVCAMLPKISPFQTSTDAGWFAIAEGEKDEVLQLNYDADGLGSSLYGQYRDSEKPIRFIVNGIHSEKSASDRLIAEEGITCKQKFMNKKGEVWWNLRERFRKTFEHKAGMRFYAMGELISIPNDDKLMRQLGSPLMVQRNGRWGVESKIGMKARNIPSPDRADALAYAFWEADNESVTSSFDYTIKGETITHTEINHAKAVGEQYVSLYQTKDFELSGIVCVWNKSAANPNLVVYGEMQESNPQPEDVVEKINEIARPALLKIKEWIVNDLMMEGLDKIQSQWNLYRRAGANIRKNYYNDERAAFVLINKMFEKKLISIHEDCPSLIAQLSNWNRGKSGEASDKYGLAMALTQIVTRLKVKKELTEEKIEEATYGGYNKKSPVFEEA